LDFWPAMHTSVAVVSNFHDVTSVLVLPAGGMMSGFGETARPAQEQSAVKSVPFTEPEITFTPPAPVTVQSSSVPLMERDSWFAGIDVGQVPTGWVARTGLNLVVPFMSVLQVIFAMVQSTSAAVATAQNASKLAGKMIAVSQFFCMNSPSCSSFP